MLELGSLYSCPPMRVFLCMIRRPSPRKSMRPGYLPKWIVCNRTGRFRNPSRPRRAETADFMFHSLQHLLSSVYLRHPTCQGSHPHTPASCLKQPHQPSIGLNCLTPSHRQEPRCGLMATAGDRSPPREAASSSPARPSSHRLP